MHLYISIMTFYETQTEFRLLILSHCTCIHAYGGDYRGVLYTLRMPNIRVLRRPVGGFSFEINIFAATPPE